MSGQRSPIAGLLMLALATLGCGGTEDEPAQPAASSSSSSMTETQPITSTEPTSSSTAPSAPTASDRWREEDVRFEFDGDEVFGILTLPASEESSPAVVLVSGSGDEQGIRDDSSARLFVDHARRLAAEGFAVLRYDPPGIGRSGGDHGLPSLEERAEETIAAIRFVSSRPEIDGNAVGLQGWSQGPWVMAMTTARYPSEVAFLISVVGSGRTVAEQQVYGIEAQTRAAGLGEEDVQKAVLFGRLLIDWQLTDPMYRELNEHAAADLGDGPWTQLTRLVYESTINDPVGTVPLVIEIFDTVADEPWAAALYLRELYLPQLTSIPEDITVEDLAALRATVEANLTIDPADFMTEVRSPVLAIFGEDDINIDSRRSALLYEQYLAEAGNDDVTIVVMPNVGHDVDVSTPGYWESVSDWLGRRHP